MLCKIRYYVDITIVSSLYVLVYPFLIYRIIAWANTYSTTLQSLFILQKKGIRLKTFLMSTQILYLKKFNIIKLYDLVSHHILRYKIEWCPGH